MLTSLRVRLGRIGAFVWSAWIGFAALCLIAAIWQWGHQVFGDFVLPAPLSVAVKASETIASPVDANAGALFVTHDISEAVRMAHRILVLASDGAGIAGERTLSGVPLQRDARTAFEAAEHFLAEDSLFAHLNDVEERRAS